MTAVLEGPTPARPIELDDMIDLERIGPNMWKVRVLEARKGPLDVKTGMGETYLYGLVVADKEGAGKLTLAIPCAFHGFKFLGDGLVETNFVQRTGGSETRYGLWHIERGQILETTCVAPPRIIGEFAFFNGDSIVWVKKPNSVQKIPPNLLRTITGIGLADGEDLGAELLVLTGPTQQGKPAMVLFDWSHEKVIFETTIVT
jgi:hypothetical protein